MLLTITVAFQTHRYQGLDQNGNLDEWPPAPTRLFQSLIAGGHRGAYALLHVEAREKALCWLQTLGPPVIETCPVRLGLSSFIHYVPNNGSDVGMRKRRGARKEADEDSTEEASPQTGGRAMKTLHAWLLRGNRVLRYHWEFDDQGEARANAEVVCALARLVTYLGRTTDTVFAEGEITERDISLLGQKGSGSDQPARVTGKESDREAEKLLYRPQLGKFGKWQSPAEGSLAHYKKRYELFLRGEHHHQHQIPTQRVTYTRSDVIDFQLPLALFELRKLADENQFLRFDPQDLRQPAAMVRHAMLEIALEPRSRFTERYGEERIAQLIGGHELQALADERTKPYNGPHIAFVPLPSINPSFTADGLLRRVLIVGYGCFEGKDRELFEDVTRRLGGEEIKDNNRPCGLLLRVTVLERDLVFPQYQARECHIWRTITPIVLTGYVRRGRTYADLVVRALEQSGIASANVESVATFTGPIVPKSDRAMNYHINENNYLHSTPRYHAEIIFKRPLTGPLVVGRGRYSGFGLMVPWE